MSEAALPPAVQLETDYAMTIGGRRVTTASTLAVVHRRRRAFVQGAVSLPRVPVHHGWRPQLLHDDACIRLPVALSPDEFLRRFLLHVLPAGFHRIRHYGVLAKGPRAPDLGRLRTLIASQSSQAAAPAHPEPAPPEPEPQTCPGCGGRLRIVEVFRRGCAPRTVGRLWMDSS